jgi:hypothetical protein
MSEAAADFFKILGNFEPRWVLAILVSMILAYKSPQLVKELFAGVRGLLKARTRTPRT